MKKVLSFLSAVMLIFVLASCSGAPPAGFVDNATEKAKGTNDNYSRALSEKEQLDFFRAQNKLFYENEKNSSEPKLPVKVDVENSDGEMRAFYVLPEKEMNNEEQLHLAQLMYGHARERLTPSSDAVQYGDIKAEAVRILTEHGFDISDKCEVFPLYQSAEEVPPPLQYNNEGIWMLKISGNGGNDYSASFYANSFKPMYIYRLAPEGVINAAQAEFEPASDYSEEEILKAAAQYFKALEIEGEITTSFGLAPQKGGACNAEYLTAHASGCEIMIDLSDLSLCGIKFTY